MQWLQCLVVLCLLQARQCTPPQTPTLTLKQFAAIQNQQQTYLSYLAYSNNCLYNQTNLVPGQLLIAPLDATTFFQEILYENQVSFWAPVRNGLTILAVLQAGIADRGYDGFLLWDSAVRGFNRQVILYNLTQKGQILFDYAYARIQVNNLNLTISVNHSESTALSPEAMAVMEPCMLDTSSHTLCFLGNGSFLYACSQAAAGFIFAPGGNSSQQLILNFTQQLIAGQYNLTPNPYVINNPGLANLPIWNCILNVRNPNTSQNYFLSYNSLTGNYTITPFDSLKSELSLLVDRIWGLQQQRQTVKWLDIFSKINGSISSFPGTLVSVFVSDHENIYIESQSSGVNYLSVINGDNQLVWNISYEGTIIFYGRSSVFILDNSTQQLYKATVDRPVFQVQPVTDRYLPNTFNYTNVIIPCDSFNVNLQYTLLWTSQNYPTALVLPLDTAPIYSELSVYAFLVESRFLVVGPDFSVSVNAPPNIQVIVIDESTITIDTQALTLVSVQIENGDFVAVVFATANGIYSVNNRREVQTLVIEPCGFSQIVSITRSEGDEGYTITDASEAKCQCTQSFNKCSLTGLAASPIMGSRAWNQQIQAVPSGMPGIESPSISKILYNLIKEGYVVVILTNNTVLLVEAETQKVVNYIVMICTTGNSTNGNIFIKQFYDPILLLFCEGSSFINQFIIRQTELIFQRQLPLYRFQTRSKSNSIFVGNSFIFIGVDLVLNVYPQPQSCCVLRIDPCEFSVSAIKEIIQAKDILAVVQYEDIDVVLLQGQVQKNGRVEYQATVKAFFPSIWITLNQTDTSQVVSNANITIIFESAKYNFAASFDLNVSFNLARVNLSANSNQGTGNAVEGMNSFELEDETTPEGELLMGTANYSLAQVLCGPVFDYFFYRTIDNMSNLEIIQNNVLTKAKILGSIGIDFIQLINPTKFSVSDLTLNDLILVVSVSKMYVFDKLLNGVQMSPITNFTLPEKHCKYYLYQVINSTAATMTSNCQNLRASYSTPLLTINYDPSQPSLADTFTYTYTWTAIPVALNQMYTVVRTDNLSTLVLGLLEGPMNSVTGKLIICEDSQCSPLYISNRYVFLISYSAHTAGNEFIVMSIDYYTIQVYMSPQVQAPGVVIPSNYTFNYTQYVNEDYCSVVKIMNFTQYNAYGVLSCSAYYYYIEFVFNTSQINVIRNFIRYSQCDLQDEFKPSIVEDKQSNLEILLAACRQNDYTFRLQTYETINSSTPVIFTGYLQIYTMNGPSGPNCETHITSPIKIVPLSSSMNQNLFLAYSVNGYNKFIYSEINGILIDNFLSPDLNLTIQYQPFIVDFQYPSFEFYAFNPFHKIERTIETEASASSGHKTVLTYLAFSVFVLANLMTLCCLLCALNQKRHKNLLLQQMQARESTATVGNELEYDENLKNVAESERRTRELTAAISRKAENRPSQIEMFFVKKK